MIYAHSAGGVIIRGNQVLTISWTDRDYVSLPKGHLDAGETSEQAALREVFEETGYRARIITSLGSTIYEFNEGSERQQKTVDYYLMELADDGDPTPQREEGEHFENLWLNIDEALERLTFDDAKEVVRKAVAAWQGQKEVL